jgi:2-oxoglutarate dehydrogenase E2 component (dihydrolipoamide succinyltransferase)
MTRHHPAATTRTLTGAGTAIALICMVTGFQVTAVQTAQADAASAHGQKAVAVHVVTEPEPVVTETSEPVAPREPAPSAPAPAPKPAAPQPAAPKPAAPAPAPTPAAPAPAPAAPAPVAPAPAPNASTGGSGG